MNSVSFELLKTSVSKEFEKFFEIYRTSINEREQKPRSEIAKMPPRSDYRILLLKKSDQIIGFSVVYLCAEYKFGLLEYMAIAAPFRNSGLGGDLLKETFQSLQSAGDYECGILEIDSPFQKCSDQDMRQRRMGFYSRHGCLLVDELKYILPLPGQGEPPEMALMIFPMSAETAVSKSKLKNWITGIYVNVYACPSNDLRIATMTSRISNSIKLINTQNNVTNKSIRRSV